MSAPTTTDWGPLAEPIHSDAAGAGDPVWKDNAYLSFWDLENSIFGTLHVSTSPNAPAGRRARCSISVKGQAVEVIESLDVGLFTSSSIHFGLDGTVEVNHPELTLHLTNRPLLTPADFGKGGAIPALVPGQPLRHYQQATEVTGTVRARDVESDVRAYGMRDRTWGFRDESAQFVEYAGLVAVFDDYFLTVLKFLGNEGPVRGDGFLQNASGSAEVEEIAFSRDAAGLFAGCRLTLAGGGTKTVTRQGSQGGFWVPMGAPSDGPAFSTYDDFLSLELDGAAGSGFFEQGILHRVH